MNPRDDKPSALQFNVHIILNVRGCEKRVRKANDSKIPGRDNLGAHRLIVSLGPAGLNAFPIRWHSRVLM